jgi:peptide/nickel transport system substrate-binding protein
VLVRNPHFRPTPTRPAGFPDRIEIKVSRLGRLETHTAAIDRGSADVTWLDDFPPRGRLPDLVARKPCRIHSTPSPGAWWMFLNVQRPPFDDPRVRRAINFATNRAELVELYGGPEAAAPTCPIVSPAFAGFSPYCPYSAAASRGGGWTAPDLEHARRLVAASGRAGARVTVDVGMEEWLRRAGPYFVSLLRDVGFRARLRVIPRGEYFTEVMRRGSRMQMGVFGWRPDYMSASTMLDPTFACNARGDAKVENVSHVCDARLNAAIDRARAAPSGRLRRHGQRWIAGSSISLPRSPTSTLGRLSSSRSGSATSPTTRRIPRCSTRCGFAEPRPRDLHSVKKPLRRGKVGRS